MAAAAVGSQSERFMFQKSNCDHPCTLACLKLNPYSNGFVYTPLREGPWFSQRIPSMVVTTDVIQTPGTHSLCPSSSRVLRRRRLRFGFLTSFDSADGLVKHRLLAGDEPPLRLR